MESLMQFLIARNTPPPLEDYSFLYTVYLSCRISKVSIFLFSHVSYPSIISGLVLFIVS